MKKTNEYYDLIDDADMNLCEGYQSMILVCPKCGALFSEKACGGRTIFPWFGYHPDDGNCRVLTDKFMDVLRDRIDTCERECKDLLKRVTSKHELDEIIAKY